MFLLLRNENKFNWTSQVVKIIISLTLLFSIAFLILRFSNQLWGSIIVSLFGFFLTYVAYLEIAKILEIKNLRELIQKFKKKK
jgi:membrane protein YdbS with pleckstrin-like domain